MYDFEDKGGRRIALRPEGTAGVARAFAQHHPTVPWKVWYVAPHFRYERPQKGRFRQHFQVGAEALGVDDPQLDVEVIALAHGFYRALGLREFTLSINSMGDDADRARYTELLRAYLLAARLTRSATRSASASPPTRCGCSTRRIPTGRTSSSTRRRSPNAWATTPAPTSRRCSTGSTGSGSRTRSTRGWCAGSTTTRAPRSSSRVRRSTPRRTASAAAAATTGWSSRWAASPRPASGSASASSACSSRARPRASCPAPSRPPTCSSSTAWRTPPRSRCWSPSCVKTASAPSAPTRAARSRRR